MKVLNNSMWLNALFVLAAASAGCQPTFECDHYTYGELGLRDVEYTAADEEEAEEVCVAERNANCTLCDGGLSCQCSEAD